MILVTGATGAISRSAARALARAGAPVRVLARDPAKAPSGIDAVAGDLERPESLGPALQGVETLVLVTPASPEMAAIHGNTLAAAKAAGVGKVVRVSAWGSSPDSPAALGRWHGQLDAAFRDSGLRYVSLLPHGFMQNTLGYAGSIKGQSTIYAPLGQGRVCYIDARDIGEVAAAAAAASQWDGQALELTGPAAFSYADLAAAMTELLGRPITYVDVPPAAAREGMLAAKLPEWLVDDLLILSKLYAADAASTPTSTVADVLGRPATPLAKFLADHRAVFAS